MNLPMPVNCRFDEENNAAKFELEWDAVLLDCAISADALKKQFPKHEGIEEQLKALAASSYIGKKAWNYYKSSGDRSVFLTEPMI
jgi:predicted alpha-1,6-mannanase (GH76 family)